MTSPDAAAEASANLLASIAAEEAELQFGRFDNDTAFALGLHLSAAARRDRLPVAITVRRHGQVLFHTGLPGTSVDNDEWLLRKCRVVERYSQSSLRVGETFRANGRSFDTDSRLDPGTYAAHGGAFPITVRDVGVVGVVAVSGLPQLADHAFVTAELRTFLATLA